MRWVRTVIASAVTSVIASAVTSVFVGSVLVGFVLTVFPGDLRAAEEPVVFDENEIWTITAYNISSTDQSGFCASTFAYNSGVSLTFMLSERINFSIALSNPDWDLEIGDVFDVEMEIDNKPLGVISGTVANNNLISFAFGGDAQVFSSFALGQNFVVTTAKQLLQFEIDEVGSSLPVMLNCAGDFSTDVANTESETTNPFAETPALNSEQQISEQTARSKQGNSIALQDTAQLILAAAGINFEFVVDEGQEALPNNITWVTEEDVAGGAIQTSFENTSSQNVALGLINAFGSTCEGDFASAITNTVVAADQTELKDARIICTGNISATYTYALILVAGETSTIFFHVADEDEKDIAQRNTNEVRAVIAEALE